jgi:hypothetical protein
LAGVDGRLLALEVMAVVDGRRLAV